jgi:hypothetical protein
MGSGHCVKDSGGRDDPPGPEYQGENHGYSYHRNSSEVPRTTIWTNEVPQTLPSFDPSKCHVRNLFLIQLLPVASMSTGPFHHRAPNYALSKR